LKTPADTDGRQYIARSLHAFIFNGIHCFVTLDGGEETVESCVVGMKDTKMATVLPKILNQILHGM
jgi:hypothetical protein